MRKMKRISKAISIILIVSLLFSSITVYAEGIESEEKNREDTIVYGDVIKYNDADEQILENQFTPISIEVQDGELGETVKVGTEIRLTVNPVGGEGEYQYQYEDKDGVVLKEWSSDNEYVFTALEGENVLIINVKDSAENIVKKEYKKIAVLEEAESADKNQDVWIETEETKEDAETCSVQKELKAEITSSKTQNEYLDRAVVLTGKTNGASGRLEYQFTEIYNGKSRVVQEYSDNSEYSFRTSGVGIHTYQLDVKDETGMTAQASYTMNVVMHPAGVLKGKLISNKTSNEYIQRDIVLSGQASGGYGELQYRFTEVYNGKSVVVQDYGTKSTYEFQTTNPGKHIYYVDIKDEEGQSVCVSYMMNVVIHPSAMLTGKVVSNKTNNEYVWRDIILSGQAQGGYGKLQYRFTEVFNGKSVVVQEYSEKSSYAFRTTNPGKHIYYVDIKDEEGQSVRVSYAMNVVMHPNGKLTGKIVNNKTNNEYIQRDIVLSGQASGGYGKLQYRFTEVYAGKTKVVQDYGTKNTYAFRTTGPGMHVYYVDIKDEKGQTIRASYTLNVVIHPSVILSGKMVSNKTSNEYIQRDIVLGGQASGGYGELQYRFTEVYNGKSVVVQDYSTKSTYEFQTTNPGKHVYYVDIKDAEGQSVQASYTLNVVIHPSKKLEAKLISNKSANEYVQRNIVLSGQASGGYGELQYRFTEVYNGKNVVVQDYGTKSTYEFQTTNPGRHVYYMDVKDEGGQVVRSSYILQVVVHPSCKLKGTLKSNVSGAVSLNQKVILTASSSGGYGSDHLYRFREKYNRGNFVLQDYSTKNTYSFILSKGGLHIYYVDIKDSEGQILTLSLNINTSEAYTYAANVLNQVGWNLYAAYNWSASLPYVNYANDPSPGSEAMALYGFRNGVGDCYVMAATFYYMAKLLGYDAHQMAGYVPLLGGGMGVHSWVEIDMNGTTYVFDPDFTNQTGRNGYQIYYGMSGTWRYSNYYRMN